MENFKREIFEKLGNLFYALAADQQLSLMESGELKMLMKKDWLTEKEYHSEDKVSEAAHLIGLTIDSLQNEKVPADDAYRMFAEFYQKHREQFSFALKRKILETADVIVKMFRPSKQAKRHFESLTDLLDQARQAVE